MRKTVLEVAEELARAHMEDDPETTDVFLAEATDEVRLVEVSGSLGREAPLDVEVFSVRFAAQPGNGVDYPSVIVLLSPQEWEAVKNDQLKLPSGWDKDKLHKVA